MRVVFYLLEAALFAGCVQERCYSYADCDAPKMCGADGFCAYECQVDADCADGFTCSDNQCLPTESETPMVCPEDMVKVADAFCIDTYEASRPDADPFRGSIQRGSGRLAGYKRLWCDALAGRGQ